VDLLLNGSLAHHQVGKQWAIKFFSFFLFTKKWKHTHLSHSSWVVQSSLGLHASPGAALAFATKCHQEGSMTSGKGRWLLLD
jgi:hypothetical protein